MAAKSGTLWPDWLILFVLMLNLHRCVQLVCNLKTVKKQQLLSDIIDNVYVFLFLRKFTLKTQQLSVTCCVYWAVQ